MILAEAGIYNDRNSKGILYQTYTATVGFLKTAVDFFRAHDLENERSNADIYQAYLMHEDADLETIAKILTVTSKFHNEDNKTKVYEAYLNRENTAPKIVEGIFKIITNYTDDFYKTALYRAYIKNKNVNFYKTRTVLTKTLSLPEYLTSSLYAAYFKRENVEPEAIAEILKIVADFKDHKNKAPVYEAYLMRVGVDLEVTDETIKAVKSAPYKFRFHMARNDADLDTIVEMLISAPLINADDKAQAYKTYMARNDADPEIIEKILTSTFKYMDRHYKAQVYKAYIESPHAEQEQVLKIVEANLKSASTQYSFFKMYLMDKHADQAHIEDVLKHTENFDEPAKTVFYLAYLAAKHAYAEDYSQFESDAIQDVESPSHLKFLLQDPEQFEKVQHAIRYRVATTDTADAITLWQMLPGLRKNQAVKRAE